MKKIIGLLVLMLLLSVAAEAATVENNDGGRRKIIAKRNYAAEDEVFYHTGLSRKMIENAEYAVLPGDPGRVRVIAEAIGGGAKPLAVNREYTSWLCYIDGVPVLVCSTGMGGPSVAIGMEELARIGVRTFIRLGTTGSIQEKINVGDVMINDSAVRLDGTSGHFAPPEFPAVADFRIVSAMVKAAERLGISYACGTGVSSDTFWPGQERYDSFTGYVPRRFQGILKEWQALGCTNMEMEAATVLTVARVFGLRAGCVCAVAAKRTESESLVPHEVMAKTIERCILLVKETLRDLIAAEKAGK